MRQRILPYVLDEMNMTAAIARILDGKTRTDTVGMPIESMPAYWLIHRDEIKRKIMRGAWRPHCVVYTSFLQKNRKTRRIAKFCAMDMALHRALMQILTPILESDFSARSYAYRQGLSHEDAIIAMRRLLSGRFKWALRLDIQSFFDTVDLEILLAQLSRYVDDDSVRFAETLLRAPYRIAGVDAPGTQRQPDKGLPQGSALSPLLSNLYLNAFDHHLEETGVHHVRFADDITCFFTSAQDAQDALPDIAAYLSEHLHVSLNQEKCSICQARGLDVLGYTFLEENNMLVALPNGGKAIPQSTEWRETGLPRKRDPIHLLSDGIITKQDMALLYEGDGFRTSMPTMNLKALHIHANVLCAPEVIQFAFQRGIRIGFHNQYGHFVGEYLPEPCAAGNRLGVKQAAAVCNPKRRQDIASRMLKSIVFNRMKIVQYYSSHGHKELTEHYQRMNRLYKQISAQKRIEDMLLLEARIQQEYYDIWDTAITNKAFVFDQRSRMPPKNEVNAMISFGNTLLYQMFADVIYQSALDIRFSFLHSPEGNRHQNLNLDLADILKPVIVDRLIFMLINKRMMRPDMFIREPGGGVYLSRMGKQMMIERMNEKLDTQTTFRGKRWSYRELIGREADELETAIESDTVYRPYHFR